MTRRKAIYLKFGLSWLTVSVILSLATLVVWDQLDLVSGTTLSAWCEEVIELRNTGSTAFIQFPFRCWNTENARDFFLLFMAAWITVLCPFWLADYGRRTRIPTDRISGKDA